MGEGKFPVSKPVGLSPAKTWESWFRFKKQQKEPKDSSKTKEPDRRRNGFGGVWRAN